MVKPLERIPKHQLTDGIANLVKTAPGIILESSEVIKMKFESTLGDVEDEEILEKLTEVRYFMNCSRMRLLQAKNLINFKIFFSPEWYIDEEIIASVIEANKADGVGLREFLRPIFGHPEGWIRYRIRDLSMVLCNYDHSFIPFLSEIMSKNVWKSKIDYSESEGLLIHLLNTFPQSREAIINLINEESDVLLQESMILQMIHTVHYNLLKPHEDVIFDIYKKVYIQKNEQDRINLARFLSTIQGLDITKFMSRFAGQNELISSCWKGAFCLYPAEFQRQTELMVEHLERIPKHKLSDEIDNLVKTAPGIILESLEVFKMKFESTLRDVEDEEILEKLKEVQYVINCRDIVRILLPRIRILYSSNYALRTQYAMTLSANGYMSKINVNLDKISPEALRSIFDYAFSIIPKYVCSSYNIDVFDLEIALDLLQFFVKLDQNTKDLLKTFDLKYMERLEALNKDLYKLMFQCQGAKYVFFCGLINSVLKFIGMDNEGALISATFGYKKVFERGDVVRSAGRRKIKRNGDFRLSCHIFE